MGTPMPGELTSTFGQISDRKPIHKKRFVDLFAGLGGFHVGLANAGLKCELACELDPELRDIYEKNFAIAPKGDIREIREANVPDHEVLCAGFPCQPFSRAGKKKGTECPASGKLIDDVFRIIQHKRPEYIILENVPDILTIAEGSFWRHICDGLNRLGYEFDFRVYSPQQFGIPQKRRRIFIVASRSGLSHFAWPEPVLCKPALSSIMEDCPTSVRPIGAEKLFALRKWQQFIDAIPEFTSLPVLASEFGATYPYQGCSKTLKQMRSFKGAFGASLRDCRRWSELQLLLPRHAREGRGCVSPRVAEAIEYSRTLYEKHKCFLDIWSEDIMSLPTSWLKLEWQGNRDKPDIWQHLIQFRASGIRIIKPDSAPSLVAMTPTQTPIIGPARRYMTLREAAALQCLDSLQHLPKFHHAACKSLGNAVNARIVREIATRLIF